MSKFPDDHPRQHYYRFAHQVFPAILFHNLEPFRGAALAGRANDGLQKLWADVATRAGASPDAGLPIRSALYECALHECAGRSVLIVVPPTAEHVTEAHFVAIVLDRKDPTCVRYVVLEHSWDVNAQPRTVVAEWVKEAGHINYGDGPDPNEAAFLAVVCERFTASEPSR